MKGPRSKNVRAVQYRTIDEHPLVVRFLLVEDPDGRVLALAGDADNRAAAKRLPAYAGVSEVVLLLPACPAAGVCAPFAAQSLACSRTKAETCLPGRWVSADRQLRGSFPRLQASLRLVSLISAGLQHGLRLIPQA